jgi:hypothetical protein
LKIHGGVSKVADDGWDAMEGSISSDGCRCEGIAFESLLLSCILAQARLLTRPTVGAMKYGDALAIAAVATELGNGTIADTFTCEISPQQAAMVHL